jgi:hypothetical protein
MPAADAEQASDSAANRIRNCRAQVQTDSLTVLLDLAQVSPGVAEAFCRVLDIPEAPQGIQLPELNFQHFQKRVKEIFAELSGVDELDGLEFATLLSVFFHECRHVHDMRGTRIGAELMLNDLQVYSGLSLLVEALAKWQEGRPDRFVPLPLPIDPEFPPDREAAQWFAESAEIRRRIARLWQARSKGPSLPGLDIRTLFETLGFWVQVEWLSHTFGSSVADAVSEGTIGRTDFVNAQYFRPVLLMHIKGQARHVALDPESYDLPQLIAAALNFSGLEEAFDGITPTTQHPGTWFDHLADAYVRVYAMDDIPVGQKSWAAELTVAGWAKLGSPQERYERADAAIQKLQNEMFAKLGRIIFAGQGKPWRVPESILLATEIAIDFRDMQRVMSSGPGYHSPLGYIALLLSGELTAVHVRVRNRDRSLGDFRMPSATPANQIGGARIASQAAQQMKFFLDGRGLSNRTFFTETMFEMLKAPKPTGAGLRFRLRPVAERGA